MNSTKLPDVSNTDLTKLELEPARPDILSVKTQVIIAFLLSSVLVFTTYWPTLSVGFLLDDFLHLDQIARALLRGDTHDFLANFYSNWGGSDIMRSFRPLVTLSLFTDFLIFKANAVGYHITNLLLMCFCCLFVALIASELSGAYGNRMRAATSIWAALIFAAYPLHVESVAWVIGRVDLLCTVFYLASLFYFLRLRLIKEPPYLWLCIGSFVLSMLSKEMAVSLPAVATVFAFLTAPSQAEFNLKANTSFISRIFRKPSTLELKAIGLLWLTLILFAGLRLLILSDAIGGYGSAGISTLLSSFANKAALLKIIAPANEEIIPKTGGLIIAGSISYIAAGVFVLFRCLITPSLIRYFAAFALMGIISLLPTFQVWNIAPNLCGSRLFFLSSAALSLALAFALIPGEDEIDRKSTRLVTVIATLILAYQLCFFTVIVRENVKPFTKAGELMKKISRQLELLGAKQDKFLLLNLPTDYKGAPMITRPQYLKTMTMPPFSSRDTGSKISTAEIDPPCDRSIYSAESIESATKDASLLSKNYWSDADAEILPWSEPIGKSGFTALFDSLENRITAPADVTVSSAKNWHVFNTSKPQIEKVSEGARISPNKHGISLWLGQNDINPLKTPLVKIKMRIVSEQSTKQMLTLIKFSWKQEKAVLSETKEANIFQTGENSFECPLINSKEWLLGGTVKAVGLSLMPGPYSVVVESIEGIQKNECVPVARKIEGIASYELDASKVKNADSILLLVSRGNTAFDTAVNEGNLAEFRKIKINPNSANPEELLDTFAATPALGTKLLRPLHFKKTTGTFQIPNEVYNDGQSHEIVVLALDKSGAMIGLPSQRMKVR